MRQGGGKQKGASYEREVCVSLSKWVSGGKREDLFWRSAMSGGRATVGKRKGVDLAAHAGDVSATHVDGHVLTDHYYVEVKRYADLNFGAFLSKGLGPLAKFWEVAVKEAAAHDRIPMLIVREDRNIPILMVPNEAMLKRGLTGHTFNLNPNAFIARMMKLKVDLYVFADVMLKPFQAPAKFNVAEGPMLKPGEYARLTSSKKAFGRIDTPEPDGAPYVEGEAPASRWSARKPTARKRR